ncbi:hypothetical protein [Curtobacterium sp. MCLR17_043]|nr:hypothetical protein [Curtobacterium sp. MCLR17_043]
MSGAQGRSSRQQRAEQLAEVSPRFRAQLDDRRHDRVGADWAGGLPAQ